MPRCQSYEGCHGHGWLYDSCDSGSGREVYCSCEAGRELLIKDRMKEHMMGNEPKYGRITSERKDIPAEEPVFLLRGQDMLAPLAVEFYADIVERALGRNDVANGIRAQAARMRAWSNRKLPD